MLSSDSVKERDAAHRALVKLGAAALAHLEEMESRDKEVAARLKLIVQEIRDTLWSLTLKCDQEKYEVGKPITITLTIRNNTGRELILGGLMVATVLDAQKHHAGMAWFSSMKETASPACPQGIHQDALYTRLAHGKSITLKSVVGPALSDG